MSNTRESIDNRNWDFKARSERIDLFSDDLDKTSATDFFNRTNGLGSPEFYVQKRIKEQENKENVYARVPQAVKKRSLFTQKPVTANINKKDTSKQSTNSLQDQKQSEDLRRRFSGVNLGPVLLPEHPQDRRVSDVKNKPAVTQKIPPTAPEKTRRISAIARPPVLKQSEVKPVVKQPVAKPVVKQASVQKPAILSTQTKTSAGPSKPMSRAIPAFAADKPKRVSGTVKPVVRQPVVLPERSENSQAPAGPMTRSREASRRRSSFMEPTESSLRRSVNFAKPTTVAKK